MCPGRTKSDVKRQKAEVRVSGGEKDVADGKRGEARSRPRMGKR